jgi:hypothetical protein
MMVMMRVVRMMGVIRRSRNKPRLIQLLKFLTTQDDRPTSVLPCSIVRKRSWVCWHSQMDSWKRRSAVIRIWRLWWHHSVIRCTRWLFTLLRRIRIAVGVIRR